MDIYLSQEFQPHEVLSLFICLLTSPIQIIHEAAIENESTVKFNAKESETYKQFEKEASNKADLSILTDSHIRRQVAASSNKEASSIPELIHNHGAGSDPYIPSTQTIDCETIEQDYEELHGQTEIDCEEFTTTGRNYKILAEVEGGNGYSSSRDSDEDDDDFKKDVLHQISELQAKERELQESLPKRLAELQAQTTNSLAEETLTFFRSKMKVNLNWIHSKFFCWIFLLTLQKESDISEEDQQEIENFIEKSLAKTGKADLVCESFQNQAYLQQIVYLTYRILHIENQLESCRESILQCQCALL